MQDSSIQQQQHHAGSRGARGAGIEDDGQYHDGVDSAAGSSSSDHLAGQAGGEHSAANGGGDVSAVQSGMFWQHWLQRQQQQQRRQLGSSGGGMALPLGLELAPAAPASRRQHRGPDTEKAPLMDGGRV